MNTIAPNDANLVYSPYNWQVGATVAYTVNTGASVKALVTGTGISATFDVSSIVAPVPRLSYRVDRGPWTDVPLAASVPISLPASHTWGYREIELMLVAIPQNDASHSGDYIKWTAPWETRLAFTGFTAAGTLTTKPYLSANRRRGLFLGDSITEGIRTLNATATAEPDRNDVRLTWAHIAAELLGCDRGIAGFGSLGLIGAGRGAVPALPSSWNYLYNGQARDLAASPPDFVAVHIGTNDWDKADADVTAATTSLVNAVLAATPVKTRVFMLRPYNGAKASAIQAGIAASSKPSRVTWIDTTGWFDTTESSDALHPYGSANLSSIGPKVAATIRAALDGGRTWMRGSDGSLVAVT